MVKDQDITRAIAAIAAGADELPPAPDLGRRLSRARRRHLVLRAMAVPVTLVLVAALGYWMSDAVRGDQMVVIDDSAGEVVGPGTTDATAAAAEEEEKGLLVTVRAAIAFLEQGEIEINPSQGHPEYGEVPTNPLGELRVYEAWLEGQEAVRITVTLSVGAGSEEAYRLAEEIKSWPEVESHSFIHNEQNRERTRQSMVLERRKTDPSFSAGDDGDFAGPRFPDLFEVRLVPTAQRAEALDRLQGDPAVDALGATDDLPVETIERNVLALLHFAEARTPEAEEWLAAHRELLKAGDRSASNDSGVTPNDAPLPSAREVPDAFFDRTTHLPVEQGIGDVTAEDEAEIVGAQDRAIGGTPTPPPDLPPAVPTERARALADSAVSAFSDLDLTVLNAVELQYAEPVVKIWLGSKSAGDGKVAIYIFKNPRPSLPLPAATEGSGAQSAQSEEVAVPGASEARMLSYPSGAGYQMLVQLPDRTVINVSSEGPTPMQEGRSPLDRAGVEHLTEVLMTRIQAR